MANFNEIISSFDSLRDEDNAKKMSAYMRDKFRFYGVPSQQRKAAYKHILSEEKKNKCIDWSLLDQCWNDDHRELQYFVVDYLSAMQKYLKFEDIERLEKYVRSKQWWDTIDGLDMIIGNIGLKDSRLNDLMLSWSVDEDFWVRRIAIDHQLSRKDKTDAELLEKILVNNLGSDEFFINKSVGWSLRAFSRTDPEWVKEFLNKYKDRMNSLSIREACKYL